MNDHNAMLVIQELLDGVRGVEDMTHEEMFAGSRIVIGRAYRFDYPDEFTSLDAYSAHRGDTVTVERPCSLDEAGVIWDDPDNKGADEIVDRMFVVRANDGWIGHAWESELTDD